MTRWCNRPPNHAAYLRAEESMRQNWVAVDAVAESDEAKAVDDDHMAGGKNHVVHEIYMEGGGAADAARKSPFAGKMNRMPRRDESGSRS